MGLIRKNYHTNLPFIYKIIGKVGARHVEDYLEHNYLHATYQSGLLKVHSDIPEDPDKGSMTLRRIH